MRCVLLGVAALSLVACGDAGTENASLGSDNTQAADHAASGNATPPARTFKIGDPVNFGAFEIKILSVDELRSVGVLDTKPAEGGVFVTVDYKLKNTGSEPLSYFDRPTLLLRDLSGRTYSPDDQATTQYVLEQQMVTHRFSGKGAGDDLNPGITTTEGAVWEIAEKQFDKRTWSVVLKGHENSPIELNGSSKERSKTPTGS